MRKIISFLPLLLFSGLVQGQHSITLRIDHLPSYHKPGSDVYVAGSFNGWNPSDSKYRFVKTDNGEYSLTMQLPDGDHFFKVTRGAWDKAECLLGGASSPNRKFTLPGDSLIPITIEEWADRFPPQPVIHTASPQVQLLDSAFYISKLKRLRRVWIYLPRGYENSRERYPVLYMHDGQNLFDNATSYSGEWGIDEFLDTTLAQKCIVIGIDHGGEHRLTEYNPFDNERFGDGEGKNYMRFLVKKLKPYVDRHYRTKKDRAHTFMAGSSMGGLISLYGALRYPRKFGAVGVFSPAFWVAGGDIFEMIGRKGRRLKAKIYLYGGKLEGETMIPDMMKAFRELEKTSPSRMKMIIRDEGQHNEPRWRKEFQGFYEWIGQN